MPIVTYFTVVGVALLAAVLFANAIIEPRGALAVTTNFEGLPPPWKGPALPRNLASTAAPEPDMDAEPVQSAGLIGTSATAATATIGQAEKVNAPEEKKQTARKLRPRREYSRQAQAPSRSAMFLR